MTTKTHGWRFMAVGAAMPAFRSVMTSAESTSSAVYVRTLERVMMFSMEALPPFGVSFMSFSVSAFAVTLRRTDSITNAAQSSSIIQFFISLVFVV